MRLGILKQAAKLRIDNETPSQKLLRIARLRRTSDGPLEKSSTLLKKDIGLLKEQGKHG